MLTLETLTQDLAQVDALKQSWLMGDGGTAAALPPHWPQPDGANDDDRALLALAYCSQYPLLEQIAVPEQLKPLSALPVLCLPTLATECRPAFRQILAALSKHDGLYWRLFNLLVSRGVAPHPLDWLPTANENRLPAAFAPWLRWVGSADIALTEASWGDFSPAARLNALRELRRDAPHDARSLLALMAPSEPADKRFDLYELLSLGLSHADLPLLETLEQDRSQKIKELAVRFKMRLGEHEPQVQDETITELQGWLTSKTRGLLRRETLLLAPELKNSVQYRERCQALASVPLPALAASMGLTLNALLEQWSFSDNRGKGNYSPNESLLHNIADSLPEAQVMLAAERLLQAAADDGTDPSLSLRILAPRLSEEACVGLAAHLLARADLLPNTLGVLFAEEWRWLSLEAFSQSPSVALLIQRLKALASAGESQDSDYSLTLAMQQIGLCLNYDCAQWLLAQITNMGLSPLHPLLEHLKFNVSLKQEGRKDE
ncbi:hypothetical protein HUF18_12455 [Thalassolituus sp. ST750PaO-4]|uniref:DUF5691 domain-containing protein n=1 Tax=Thalassolituus sp. ST750PaO-4 TaxID=2742965 RepID=UPI001CE2B5F7|nr:DUF5691 domain-containing protein [Thalassolituus sp. ST750PaO-4]MCA6060593.1 hypothetical protein [Thalassolituus sp. ST750PaO-4]